MGLAHSHFGELLICLEFFLLALLIRQEHVGLPGSGNVLFVDLEGAV